MLPPQNEYAPFYHRYIAALPQGEILDILRAQGQELARVAAGVAPERETFAYAPDKWTIRQLFGHVADAERIFGYRALCISRGDTTPLPGFDENAYAARAPFAARPLRDIAEELTLLRRANVQMLAALDDEAWTQIGNANGHPISVRALAWVIAGHAQHHLGVLRERYGVA
jgi:uncharacterized damage-inducible protein DinB